MMTGEQASGFGAIPPTTDASTSRPPRRRRYLLGAVALIAVFAGGGYAIASAVVSGNTTSATSAKGTPRARAVPVAQGLVSAVDQSARTFTIASRGSGPVVVHVMSSTRYSVPGPSIGSTFADVTKGLTVVVYGTSNSSNGVTATSVIIGQSAGGFANGAPRPGGSGGRAGFGSFATSGTVKTVDRSQNRFTMTTRSGSVVIVVVSSATTYQSLGGATGASFANLAVGDRALVSGTTAADKSVHATQVVLLPAGGGFGRGGFGQGGAGAGGQQPNGNSGIG